MTSKYTPEEQAEHRRVWVEALKSGEYVQGRNALCQKNGDSSEYCCLGVACEISGLGEFVPKSKSTPNAFTFVTGRKTAHHLVLPKVVRDWLGLRICDGSYHGNGISMVTLNDRGMSFRDLADIIESEPEGLVA